jgi:hypothetical protein
VFGVLQPEAKQAALTTYYPTTTLIQIKDGLEPGLRQNAEMHELLHIQLQHEGFPAKYPGGGSPQNNPAMNILDCVSHPMIDSRMKAAGWKPDLLLQTLVDNYEHKTLEGNNNSYKMGVGLDLYCLSLRVGSENMEKVNERFIRDQPYSVIVEQTLINKFGDLSCGAPDPCFQLAKRLRDAVFTPSVLLTNPKTGMPE